MAFVRRAGAAFMIVLATTGLAACVGGTDPATNVRSTQARLHAHGYTNAGPAEWWWEISVSQRIVETGRGAKRCGTEPDGRCGPASSPTEVRLSTVVTGLLPNTTYYFRACGQDTNGPRSCAAILSFTTTMADSTAAVSGGVLTFTATAGAATANVLASRRFTDTDGIVKYRLEDLGPDFQGGRLSIVPGAGCSSIPGRPVDDTVNCPAAGITRIRALLNDGDDWATTDDSVTVPSTLDGGAGRDRLWGGDNAADLLITGPDGVEAFGGDVSPPFFGTGTFWGGNDTFETRNGAEDRYGCGAGFDVANTGPFSSDLPADLTCEQINVGPE